MKYKTTRKCKTCGQNFTTRDKRIKYCSTCRKSYKEIRDELFYIISGIRRRLVYWHPDHVLKLYYKVVEEEGKAFADLMLGKVVNNIKNNYPTVIKRWRKTVAKYREKQFEALEQRFNKGKVVEKGKMIEVFTDGACEPVNPKGVGTFGFIIYKGNKKIAEEAGLVTSKYSSNNIAEYMAVNKAFNRLFREFYIELFGKTIVFKSDSRLVVNQLNGSYKVLSQRIRPYYIKTKKLIKMMKQLNPQPKISFKWIPREENKEADKLTINAYENFCKHNPEVLHEYARHLATKKQMLLMQRLKIPYGVGISKYKASKLIDVRLTELKEKKKG